MASLQITIQISPNAELSYVLSVAGQYNTYDYWTFDYFGTTYFVWHTAPPTDTWYITEGLGSFAGLIAEQKGSTAPCPEASLTSANAWISSIDELITECIGAGGITCDIEDRHQRSYKAIKLPKVCVDEDRGLDYCCCEYLVLGNAGSDTWKNDLTSAWIKLSEPTDVHEFKLYKNGVLTTYSPVSNEFANTDNAYYCTIDWYDVLVSDGVGCYELIVEYEISGILGQFSWGKYNVQPFTIQNALKTARIRAKFDGYHELEQIDFTGSAVESTFRFNGYIGNRQPNMEIDNIIYSNREMKRVIRENLNSYEIVTDPSLKCITEPLLDLYLLSENELYISDYNAHNHDYCLNDIPVIVKESPTMDYYDFSRKAKLTCVVEDKFKNKRTYY